MKKRIEMKCLLRSFIFFSFHSVISISGSETFIKSLLLAVNLSTFRNLYARMPELRLSAPPSRVVSNISTEACARTCVEEAAFECKSFDVDNLYRTCLLFNTSYEEGQAFLQESRHVDHYRSKYRVKALSRVVIPL